MAKNILGKCVELSVVLMQHCRLTVISFCGIIHHTLRKQGSKMKEFTYTYLHVPTIFSIQMGIDRVEKRTVQILAKNKKQADVVFSQKVKDYFSTLVQMI
jgi:hypothetical protein